MNEHKATTKIKERVNMTRYDGFESITNNSNSKYMCKEGTKRLKDYTEDWEPYTKPPKCPPALILELEEEEMMMIQSSS